MKERLYNLITKYGIKAVQKCFPEYFARQPLQPTDRYREYNFVSRFLPPLPATILDVGCSGSYFPLILAGLGYKVTGIDIRPYGMEAENFEFMIMDISRSRLTPFDCITCVSTLEHIGVGGRYGVKDDPLADYWAVENIMKMTDRAIFTLPFGKPKIIKPYTRIYGVRELEGLFGSYRTLMEFYRYEDWTPMEPVERNNDAYTSDLCCIVVSK
jgi:SAM-dependent methyltransferase